MTVGINRATIEGFVKYAHDHNLDPVKLAWIQGRMAIATQDNVRAGMDSVLKNYKGGVSKSAFAKVMHPESLAQIVEDVVNESPCWAAEEMRQSIPEHQRLTEMFKSASSQASLPMDDSAMSRFARLPLSDKLVLLGQVGAGVGAAQNAFMPVEEDMPRSKPNRAVRGAIRGTGTALGGAGGAILANLLADSLVPGNKGQSHPLASLLGAGLGGLAGYKATSSVL